MRIRTSLFTATTVAALALGVVTPANATTSPFGTKSPAAILSIATTAMRSAGTFHYASETKISGVVEATIATDSSASEGTQTQKSAGGIETTKLIGKNLYIEADKTAYTQDFGVKNSTLANKWVFVPVSNKNYVNISSAVLLSSVIHEVEGFSKLTDAGVVTVDGQKAVAIEGDIATNSTGSGTQAVYVSTIAPYRPIAIADEGTFNGQKVSSVTLFSKWGEKISVAKPTAFVTATSKTFP
jgi:nitric oxide reductase large subunit